MMKLRDGDKVDTQIRINVLTESGNTRRYRTHLTREIDSITGYPTTIDGVNLSNLVLQYRMTMANYLFTQPIQKN